VPIDTPIFLLLGSDKHAPHTIFKYAEQCENLKQQNECAARAREFMHWQDKNKTNVHEPDGRI